MNDYLFINGNKVVLAGKTQAQLQHLLQLAKDQVERYARAIENYQPRRMEMYGRSYQARLQNVVDRITQRIAK